MVQCARLNLCKEIYFMIYEYVDALFIKTNKYVNYYQEYIHYKTDIYYKNMFNIVENVNILYDRYEKYNIKIYFDYPETDDSATVSLDLYKNILLHNGLICHKEYIILLENEYNKIKLWECWDLCLRAEVYNYIILLFNVAPRSQYKFI